MKQFETLRFSADAEGQKRKNLTLGYLCSRGWRVLSETIEKGNFKGGEACCLAFICLPLGFAAGHDPNISVLTVERDQPERGSIEPHKPRWIVFDDDRVVCDDCQLIFDKNAVEVAVMRNGLHRP